MASCSGKINCAELLSHVQRAESTLPESSETFFGHPPPPDVHVMQLSGDNVSLGLGAAVTKRCVSAQLWQDGETTGEPLEILCLSQADTDDEEEEITCAALLALGIHQEGGNNALHAAIAVGTSSSRVISVELEIQLSGLDGNPSLSMLPIFEPLPLDPPQDVADDASITSGASRQSRNSQHSLQKKQSSLRSLHELNPKNDNAGKPEVKFVSFRPSGGVTSVSCYKASLNDDDDVLTSVVWVAYRDGTMVRLHHAAFFSSVLHNPSFHDDLRTAAFYSRVLLPPSCEGMTVVPLPKYHPSPLAPLPPWKPPPRHDDDEMGSPASTAMLSDDEDHQEDEEEDDVVPNFHEALVYVGDGGTGEQFPALSFYTSEDQFIGRITGEDHEGRNSSSNPGGGLLGNVIGGTTSLVSGVFGAAFGVVQWGLGHHSEKTHDEVDTGQRENIDTLEPDEEDFDRDMAFLNPMFPALHGEPSALFAGFEMHDSPRQITSVTVDPDGNLAATTDTLGRVLLIDLCIKQVARMWKGVREASCAWIEVPRPNVDKAWQKRKILYLAIHSRQRRTVDIYRTRHGPKVKSMQVGRDAQLIQSIGCQDMGPFACCYLLHSAAPGVSLNHMELLVFEDEATGRTENSVDVSTSPGLSAVSIHEAAMRLQLLQQLLAKTNVPSERQDVFEALTQITSLKDLCTALDILAVASQLEDTMGVIGSEFHSLAVAHCRQTVENVLRNGGKDASENAQVKMLASRILYHTQLVEAYVVLHEFETKTSGDDEQDERVAPRSGWAVEAMAWLTMYETVSGTSVDAACVGQTRPVLQFWAFAKACSDSKQKIPLVEGGTGARHKIYLTDSTKMRKEVLVHIFKPLLRDIFAFNVVSSIFDSMGIKSDLDYLLRCFGDWFVSISAREAARKGCFQLHSPMVRWLQDMVTSELESVVAPQGGLKEGENSSKPVLRSLHKFCSEATDLVRAFLLATLCREAVSIATKRKEAKTYGQVSSSAAVKPWNQLLRKLRVCLLVSLRLNGMNLGAFPVTVSNVEANDIFSVYEWLARDELTMSHTHEEIVSLENACRVSGLVFDPSSEAGDNPGRWKMLQQACLAAAISEEEREEFLLDMNDDDQLGALLLYLGHYNNPALLVAHRALLLARQFVQRPNDLQPLRDCLDALRGLHDDEKHRGLSAAIRMEVWQSAVRPFYRATLFGFDDVHELTEDIAGPLLDNRDWLRGLGMIALPILDMLSLISWDDAMNEFEIDSPPGIKSWPPVKEDFILKRIVEKSRPVNAHSLDIHRVVVCGNLLSDNMESLAESVPDLYDCFLPMSLFQAMSGRIGNTDMQMEFLERAVIDRANEVDEESFGRLVLGEIETLARLWDVDLRDIRTLFLLAMYELGKDNLVDESLSTCTAASLDVERFISDGLDIACRRLNRALNLKRSAKMRSIMGMLDADTCEWLRERAEESTPLLEGDDGDSRVSMSHTHLLILRLLGLCSMTGDKTNATKIHSLSILSGTLLKALEEK